MASGVNPTHTAQDTYNLNMLTLLKENRGGKIRKICQIHSEKGSAKATFYRIGEASTTTTIDMYDTANYSGTGGGITPVEVEPTPAYAHDKLTETQLLSTKLDLKGAYLQSLIRAVQRDEDKKIITAISGDASIQKIAMPVGGLGLEANFKKFISTLKKVAVTVEDAPDRTGATCLVVMHVDQFAELYETEFWTNSLYSMINGNNTGDGSFGIEFVKYKGTGVLASGKLYIIPNGAVGYADWGADGMKATLEYKSGDDKWWLMAKHSMASKCIDPTEIVEMTFATS